MAQIESPKSLEELNGFKRSTWGLIVVILFLIVSSIGGFLLYNNYNKTQQQDKITAKQAQNDYHDIAILDTETEVLNKVRVDGYKPYAAYIIGVPPQKKIPHNSDGNIQLSDLSGMDYKRVNYFKVADGFYIRSTYGNQSLSQVSCTLIPQDKLKTWTTFDKAQDTYAKAIKKGGNDTVALSTINNLESKNAYLRN